MEIQSADCPKCGAGISEQINHGKIFKCGNCGSSLVWPDHQSKLLLSFGSRLCPACGIDNDQNRNFCRNCGAALTKTCPVCKAVFYVGDYFCPNGHNPEIEQQKLEQRKRENIEYFLQESKDLAFQGNLEDAALILEEALSINRDWAPKIAGFPLARQQVLPVSGYALLVHLAGKTGKKQLAIQYLKRMLELNSEYPGNSLALLAAQEAKIEKEAIEIARAMGIPWF